MGLTERVRSHPVVATTVGVTGLAVLALLLYLFQPWQLFVDTTVEEALPTAAPVAADSPVPDEMIGEDAEMAEEMPADGPAALLTGAFGDRSHPTSGTATVYRLEDGSRVLRLEDLATDNGPDLYVYLTTAPADAAAGEVDAEFVDLGRLKGNLGDQNYAIADDVELDRYPTVAIWCDRFDVVFGTAALAPA